MEDAALLWINSFQYDFDNLMALLSIAPILHCLNWKFPFHMTSNSSDISLGVVPCKKNIKCLAPSIMLGKN